VCAVDHVPWLCSNYAVNHPVLILAFPASCGHILRTRARRRWGTSWWCTSSSVPARAAGTDGWMDGWMGRLFSVCVLNRFRKWPEQFGFGWFLQGQLSDYWLDQTGTGALHSVRQEIARPPFGFHD
jgi:hypothetical protein